MLLFYAVYNIKEKCAFEQNLSMPGFCKKDIFFLLKVWVKLIWLFLSYFRVPQINYSPKGKKKIAHFVFSLYHEETLENIMLLFEVWDFCMFYNCNGYKTRYIYLIEWNWSALGAFLSFRGFWKAFVTFDTYELDSFIYCNPLYLETLTWWVILSYQHYLECINYFNVQLYSSK